MVVHRRQLLDQWLERLKIFLDIPDEYIGQIGGNQRRPSGIIDVCMMQSLNRNEMIVNDIIAAYKTGRSSIILTERKEHLNQLYDLLANEIQDLIVLKGGMGKRQRQAATAKLQKTPDRPVTLLSTGRYLGEGFDDPRLDVLFLTLPVSWKGVLTQYAGRLHRTHDMKKEVIIYDYADLEVPMLIKMYRRRLAGYKAIGYEIAEQKL